MNCRMPKCNGIIDDSKFITVERFVCGMFKVLVAHPCDTCRRAHWSGTGDLMYTDGGLPVFIMGEDDILPP